MYVGIGTQCVHVFVAASGPSRACVAGVNGEGVGEAKNARKKGKEPPFS